MFLKIGINQNGKTPYYSEKLHDFTVGFADPIFPIRCATVLELLPQQIGDFYEKPHFTMENFKFREPVKWGLKIFALNYQKAYPYAKSGQTNRFAYVAVTFFDTRERREKKYARIAIGKSKSITLRPLSRRRDEQNQDGAVAAVVL